VTGLASTTGALTATATNGGLSFGAINSGAAATLRARTALSVAGLAQAAGTLDALSSAGAVSLGSAQAATVLLRGATGVAVAGGTTATGPVTITADTGPVTTGDISSGAATSVTATTGAVTLASVSRTAGLTVAAATDATIAGDINSSGDVGVTATGGSATIGSVSNAGKLTVTAANNATVNGQVNTSADTAITATNGSATVVGAVKTANYTIKASIGTIALGSTATATQGSSGTVTLDSQRLTLGTGLALVATKQIQLDVTGNAAGVSLGDGAGAAIDTTKYALGNSSLRALQSPIVQIAAGSLPVDIGALNLDGVTPVGGGFAGITSAFGIATTGTIRVADALTFTSNPAAPRVLTLGGITAVAGTADTAVGGNLDKTTPTATAIEVLVGPQGLDNAAPTVGGQIDATGSTVQLRATYIALGEATPPAVPGFVSALLPSGGTPLTSLQTRTSYVNNPNSTLYVASPPYSALKATAAPQALVQAGTLVLAPGQWALIQNTEQSTTPGGGIIATTVKFNKVAGGAAADPEIAVFGSINGKTGIASAISVDAGNLDGISPNNIRINGCVALSTGGCIQSGIAIPGINLTDPGQYLQITTAPDLALSVELITGATNEALWREDDDTPGQNRPQRESRP
jgi:filamentous hemagglutinin